MPRIVLLGVGADDAIEERIDAADGFQNRNGRHRIRQRAQLEDAAESGDQSDELIGDGDEKQGFHLECQQRDAECHQSGSGPAGGRHLFLQQQAGEDSFGGEA